MNYYGMLPINFLSFTSYHYSSAKNFNKSITFYFIQFFRYLCTNKCKKYHKVGFGCKLLFTEPTIVVFYTKVNHLKKS